MKKFLMSAAIVAAMAAPAVAQDEFGPAQGDFSVELQFNPFSDNFETFKIDQIKGRYFFTDKDAIRFGIGFGVHTDKTTTDPDNASDVWTKNRTGNFSINLGYERTFLTYKRVSLYAGAGLGFELVSTCETEQFAAGNDILKKRTYNTGSYNLFTVNAFTGIDFYVYKGLFVGAELGIKVGFKNFPGIYTKGDYNDNGTWNEDLESDHGKKSTNFDFGTYAEPALRLGYTF